MLSVLKIIYLRLRKKFSPASADDPRVLQLMSMWGQETRKRWPIGVVWFATYLIFLGTAYGTLSGAQI